ncbi:helix-turn-helix domain-containing protein [Nocardia carnea]|uniref:helix-turn-helix domain-containing protein n=1 Tax=Nocardia carnea TaxID=37328 RepID=UPI002454884C|nr:helix-turn-helix domain-containing protein [Nocardia carnea]
MTDSRSAGTFAPGQYSPPTARVLQVLDFLVHHQGQRFGLSELARRCDITKPTCLGIITELTEWGYLTRDAAEKTYGLGPALVKAGRAAQHDFAFGSIVHDRLDVLSKRFGTVCTAAGVVGGKIMLLDVAGPPGVRPPAVGEVYPYAPPVGLMFTLWQPDGELERWLQQEPALISEPDLERVREVAADCRNTGYLIERLTPTIQRLNRLIAGVAASDLPPDVRAAAGELASNMGERMISSAALADESQLHSVNFIAAPTFDSDGRQALVLTVNVGGEITGADIAERGAALLEITDEITNEVGGRNPFE